MNTCKTCQRWKLDPPDDDWQADAICRPLDPDTYQPMNRGFETRKCTLPHTFYEPPVERNGFALCDGSQYHAALYTAEDFGCIRHEATLVDAGPIPADSGSATQ